ncbi:hypothetical protein BJ508DRAFT_340962 [Ascobolus immersus RN42]|uniref:Uncharacterized protein n=1 Tax=Ascobolus immersus RN42 TaxID=1160509 RepID=A0A3N4HNP2_ASCIM|nr:hypothetical protein BJ508DRAFT_340962 [Ascobolus immersus RN42]
MGKSSLSLNAEVDSNEIRTTPPQRNQARPKENQTPLQARIARLETRRKSLLQRVALLNERRNITFTLFKTPIKELEITARDRAPLDPPFFRYPVTFRNITDCEDHLRVQEEMFEDMRKRALFSERLDEALLLNIPFKEQMELVFGVAREFGFHEGPAPESIEESVLKFRQLLLQNGIIEPDEMVEIDKKVVEMTTRSKVDRV